MREQDNSNFYAGYPVHQRLQERAPGFTLGIVDQLVRQAWAEGFETGVADMQPKIRDENQRLLATLDQVGQVIRGQLIHITRGLRYKPTLRPKTTIAAEREWMEAKALELEQAIDTLEQVCANA